jgi:hypothetical protein
MLTSTTGFYEGPQVVQIPVVAGTNPDGTQMATAGSQTGWDRHPDMLIDGELVLIIYDAFPVIFFIPPHSQLPSLLNTFEFLTQTSVGLTDNFEHLKIF